MTKRYKRYGIALERIASVVAFATDRVEDTTVDEFTVGPTNRPRKAIAQKETT